MIELGPDEALTHSPDWIKLLFEQQAGQAAVATTGDPEFDLMSELDGERVGRARMKEVSEIARRQLEQRSVNWSVIAYPNEGWAAQVFGTPDVERLWEAVAYCTRLDEPDPVVAVGLGTLDHWWKPVLQVFSSRGRPLGYVKVGWTPITAELVRTEGRSLEAYAASPVVGLIAPRLVHRGTWGACEIVVTAPMPRDHWPDTVPKSLGVVCSVVRRSLARSAATAVNVW